MQPTHKPTVQISTSRTEDATTNSNASAPEEGVDAEALVARIAADCRHEPQRYLNESIVPFGGE